MTGVDDRGKVPDERPGRTSGTNGWDERLGRTTGNNGQGESPRRMTGTSDRGERPGRMSGTIVRDEWPAADWGELPGRMTGTNDQDDWLGRLAGTTDRDHPLDEYGYWLYKADRAHSNQGNNRAPKSSYRQLASSLGIAQKPHTQPWIVPWFPGHALREKGLQRQKGAAPVVSFQERRAAVVPVINRSSIARRVPRFPDMPCMNRVYKNKRVTVHWLAARNEERVSSRG